MYIDGQYLLFLGTTLFHLLMSWREKKSISAPGELIKVSDSQVHLWIRGTGTTTVILDHSLGGIEGYFLLESIASLTRVCIYDRPGYGWSSKAYQPRSSAEIVEELNLLLTKTMIEPPYVLVGDSFGSYNMRLYAHHFPQNVKGLVLTDGLHESGFTTAKELIPVLVKIIGLIIPSTATIERAASSISRALNSERERSAIASYCSNFYSGID